MSLSQPVNSITNADSLRVAIIGYGFAGALFHAPLITATPGMHVAAIVARNPERQHLARTQYPEATIFSDVQELWRNTSHYDLTVVATSNRTHTLFGTAAMEAGLPVVIDKPITATVADAELLVATSKKTDTLLSVFQNRRWDNDFLTVRQLIAANLLGPIVRYESRYEYYRPTLHPSGWRESPEPEDAGGILYDIGSHTIDQALFLFGMPELVYAEMQHRRPNTQVDDDTFIALHFSNGVRAHLWMSAVAHTPGQRIRVSGSQGTYEKWGMDPQEDALVAGLDPGSKEWGVEPRERWGRLSAEINGVSIHGQVETVPGAYAQYYALLRDALIAGEPPPVDPLDTVNALRVIEAAQRSARERQAVAIIH